MTEQEALIRAREACIAAIAKTMANDYNQELIIGRYRSGYYDDQPQMKAVVRALLDLDKPLPVGRDLADLRELETVRCEAQGLTGAALRYRHGCQDTDDTLRKMIPTFRAIIQRRIKEAGK